MINDQSIITFEDMRKSYFKAGLQDFDSFLQSEEFELLNSKGLLII